jgi:hypothetical protein
MNLIRGPGECVEIVRFLTKNFKELFTQQEADVATLNSVGQVAVECVSKNVELANGWLEDWVEETLGDDAEEEEDGGHKRRILLYEFLALCGVFLDSSPELVEELVLLEKLFIPQGPQLMSTLAPQTAQSSKGDGKKGVGSRTSTAGGGGTGARQTTTSARKVSSVK